MIDFPEATQAMDDGLLCVGGDLAIPTLLAAYRKGIFPWPQEGLPLLWFAPPRRGILDFADLHLSRSFLKAWHKPGYVFSFNRAFQDVIRACADTPRTHETGTWIVPSMQAAYWHFHQAGYAHSIECWHDDRLVGGLYGVYVDGVFSGESMFFRESEASKKCLYALLLALRKSGVSWLDTQMVTPVVKQFGGAYVEREEFLRRLRNAQKKPSVLQLWEGALTPLEIEERTLL